MKPFEQYFHVELLVVVVVVVVFVFFQVSSIFILGTSLRSYPRNQEPINGLLF